MCDYREKYKNLYMRILNKLNLISKENDDVSTCYEALDRIDKSICSWLQCNLDYNGIMVVYNKGIVLLNDLDKRIENKYEYSIRYKNVNYLIDLSGAIIRCLSKIDSNLDGCSKDFINDIYKIAYQVIKLEFYYYNSSIVWNYCKENDKHKLHISRYIMKDVKKYNYNILNKDKFINEEFIRIISKKECKVLEDDLFKLLDGLKKKLEDIIKEISKNRCDIVKSTNEIEKIKLKIEEYKRYKVKCFIKALGSWLLTISILGGAIYGCSRGKKYHNYIEKYSSIDDSFSKIDNGYKRNTDLLQTYIVVYGDARFSDNKYDREAYIFNIKDIKSDDINDYFGVDLSCYSYEVDHIVEDNPVSTKEYTEIYKQKIDKNNYNYDFSINDMFIYMICFILLTLTLEKLSSLVYRKSKFGIISPWINLYNDLKGNGYESYEDMYKRLSSDNYGLKKDINELLKDKEFILSLYNEIINNKEFNYKINGKSKRKRINE